MIDGLVHILHRVNYTQKEYLCYVMEGALARAVTVTHDMEDEHHPVKPVITFITNADSEFDEADWKNRLHEVLRRVPNDRRMGLVINSVKLQDVANIGNCAGAIAKSIYNVWEKKKISEPPFMFLTIFIGFKPKKEDYELLEKMSGITVIYTPERKRASV